MPTRPVIGSNLLSASLEGPQIGSSRPELFYRDVRGRDGNCKSPTLGAQGTDIVAQDSRSGFAGSHRLGIRIAVLPSLRVILDYSK